MPGLQPNRVIGNSMWKMVLIAAVALVTGFLAGTYYIQRDVETATSMSLAVRVLRQDKVLTYLEQGDVTTAKRVQGEFLKSSILELGNEKAWPQEVEIVVNKRKSQALGR